VFDGAGYYKEVREELIKSQTASPEELAALASARAQAIVSALTAAGAVDPSRVTAAPPEEVKKSKKGIEPLIPSELVMPKD
jgi:hypothetical protein